MTKEEALRSFEKTGGILKGHFVLTSGRHADTYMQCAKLFVDPAESVKLCGALCELLKKYNADMIVSPAVGGIIMGYEVARQLSISNFFTERVDGKMTLRRGFELPRGRAIIVEDVITTGGSVKEVIELVRAAGVEPVAAAVIVDRSAGSVDLGIPLVSLVSMEIQSFEAENCPMCKAGTAAVKPGSRGLK